MDSDVPSCRVFILSVASQVGLWRTVGGEGRTGRTGLDQRVGPKAHAVAHSALFRRRRARLLLTSDATARRSVAVCSGAPRCLEPLRARRGHLVCGLGPALVASIEARPGAHWEHTAVRVWGWTRTRSTSVAAVEWSSVVCTPSRAHWVPCALVLHGFWSLQRSKSRSKHCQACVGGCGASMWGIDVERSGMVTRDVRWRRVAHSPVGTSCSCSACQDQVLCFCAVDICTRR